MPKGPKGQKRPRDLNQRAKRIVDIATGEARETKESHKDEAAAAMGRKGGKARAASLTKEKRAEIARRAAQKRWAKD